MNDIVKDSVRSSFFRYCLDACHRLRDIQESRDDLYEVISAQCKHCGSSLSMTRTFPNSYHMRMGGSGIDYVCLRMIQPSQMTCPAPIYFNIPWEEPDLSSFYCPKFKVFR